MDEATAEERRQQSESAESIIFKEVVRVFEKMTRIRRASEVAVQREVRFVERPKFCSHC